MFSPSITPLPWRKLLRVRERDAVPGTSSAKSFDDESDLLMSPARETQKHIRSEYSRSSSGLGNYDYSINKDEEDRPRVPSADESTAVTMSLCRYHRSATAWKFSTYGLLIMVAFQAVLLLIGHQQSLGSNTFDGRETDFGKYHASTFDGLIFVISRLT